jgi:predicted transposase/invertase (TIGR01784 family)
MTRQKYYAKEKAVLDKISATEGEKKALEEGAKKASIQVAKNTLKMGMDIEIIMKVTGLSKEEIEEIKKDIQEDNSN